MRTPAPLRHLDDASLAVLRRLGALLVRPVVLVARWEHDGSPSVVRAVASHPGLVAVLAGLLVVAAAGVHLVRFPDRSVVPEVAGPAEVGPVDGVDLEAYTRDRHELLGQLAPEDEVRAIVSFHELVAVGALPLPADVRVERLHVRLPGELEPRQLPAVGAERRLAALFADGRAVLDRDIAEVEQLLTEDLGDEAFEREYRDELERLRAARDDADADAAVVFAAVVVAPAARLDQLAATPAVRLVDVAGPPERTGATRFVGVPPRVTDRASTGHDASSGAAP